VRVAGVSPTDRRVRLSRDYPLAGDSGAVGHWSPATAGARRYRDWVRPACALGGRVACLSWSSNLPSLWWRVARQEEGSTWRASEASDREPVGRAPEVLGRPGSRNQWPPLPASQRCRAVWWHSGLGW